MRILFLCTWFPFPPDNGSKTRVYHLLRALGRRHSTTLLSFAFETARPEQAVPADLGCEAIEVVPHDPFERRHLAWALRFFSPQPVVERPVAGMVDLVNATLDETSFDVVTASTTAMAAYALQAEGVPKVLEEHNCWSRPAFDLYRAQTNPMKRLRYWASWQKRARYESRIYRRFALITMVSGEDGGAASSLLAGDRGRVQVIPNGVDCEHNRPGLAQPRPNSLVFNGALTYSANYDAMRYFLAEIYPLIQQQLPDVSLTITGSTSGVDLAGLLLDGSVHLSGYVDDVRPLVAGAWVCVVPLRQGGGTRLKILEAMALGTPVISTTKGAEGLAATPERDLLLANEPAEFAAQVVRLARDPGLRARLAYNARRLVEERYDWAAIGARFVDLVEAVVRERGA